MYEVVLTRRALKDLENIDRAVQNRIATKLKEYSKDPITHSKKLISHKIGTYRFRMGGYRVIFDIDDGNIIILRIGHRRSIYR